MRYNTTRGERHGRTLRRDPDARARSGSTPPATTPQPTLTRAEMATFLRDAKIVKAKDISKGSDRPAAADALERPIDARRRLPIDRRAESGHGIPAGRREMNFVDSLALQPRVVPARRAARHRRHDAGDDRTKFEEKRRFAQLVGRNVDGRTRSREEKEGGAEPDTWNQQMQSLRVFTQLVDDTDRNLGNVLITPEWKLIMIDFTRAFRLAAVIKPEDLAVRTAALRRARASGRLDALTHATTGYLTADEAKAVIARRDLIVDPRSQAHRRQGRGGGIVP